MKIEEDIESKQESNKVTYIEKNKNKAKSDLNMLIEETPLSKRK